MEFLEIKAQSSLVAANSHHFWQETELVKRENSLPITHLICNSSLWESRPSHNHLHWETVNLLRFIFSGFELKICLV